MIWLLAAYLLTGALLTLYGLRRWEKVGVHLTDIWVTAICVVALWPIPLAIRAYHEFRQP